MVMPEVKKKKHEPLKKLEEPKMLARVNNGLDLMPWRNLATLQNDFLNYFAELDDFWQQHSYPRVKVENGEKDVKVSACLPGCDEKNIAVEIVNDFITIKAERPESEAKPEMNYLRRERSLGHYEETLKLGAHVRSDAARAVYKNGMLEITLPKAEIPAPTRIAINA